MSSKVEEYISKQDSPQKEICRKLRELILKTFPDTTEEMRWGVPAYHDGRYYIVALKDHVNLGFSIEGLTKEDMAQFDGGGKTMKHLQIRDTDIDEDKIVELLKLVDNRGRE